MDRLAIIGGSGLASLHSLVVERQEVIPTPFGAPSAPLIFGRFDGLPVVFLPRHGAGHQLPPHRVNYRANVWALHHVGVAKVVGVAAVGGISQPPGAICVPDQIIDYTWGRESTFFDVDHTSVVHIDFTDPYCSEVRQDLIRAAERAGVIIEPQGTYGATQGPRLESAAEIRRMERDGCDLVGMTGMPEAALAKEKKLCYACCAFVVNWAAGKTDGPISMDEINANLVTGVKQVKRLLGAMQV